ncbi:hypothetical protein LTR15_009399 [Elasticomyces elasticus]|nr:hypothetical protein LTR15_009399 [Elasticomyces elasticus]
MEFSEQSLARSTPSLRRELTTLCRFVSNVLVKEQVDFYEVEFIAFSHVWGDPGEAGWCNIEGVADHVIASPSKAQFLTKHLRELVGNQESAENRIAVTRIIPELYNRAQKTIVIRDGHGFRACYAEAVGQLPTLSEWAPGLQRWTKHWKSVHQLVLIREGILHRLWPLQECILSNNIQFVSEEPRNLEEYSTPDLINIFSGGENGATNVSSDTLWTLSRALATYGTTRDASTQSVDRDQISFMRALLNNGSASRAVVGRSPFSTSIGHEFLLQNNSIRTTAKARDYVLSTLSQYDWYVAPSPQEVRQMGFTALYKDCYSQARAARYAVIPRITSGMVGDTNGSLETSNVPEPKCLGDFVKLFGLASAAGPSTEQDCALGLDYGNLELRPIDTNNVTSVFEILERSFEFSRETWELAFKGELVEHGFWPDDKAFRADIESKVALANATKILNLTLTGFLCGGPPQHDAMSFRRDLVKAKLSNYASILLRLGALVSCGIGISAFKWSESVMTPVLAVMESQVVLAMIASCEDFKHSRFHIAHPLDSTALVTYKHFLITRVGDGFRPRHRCVGLLPDFTSDMQNVRTFLYRSDQLWVIGKPAGLMRNLE